MNDSNTVQLLLSLFEKYSSTNLPSNYEIGYDFKKRIITVEANNNSEVIHLNELRDTVGDERANEIWTWVRS